MYVDSSVCPPDEVLACLVDLRLDEEPREAALTHAADCPLCRFVLAECMRWGDAPREESSLARRSD